MNKRTRKKQKLSELERRVADLEKFRKKVDDADSIIIIGKPFKPENVRTSDHPKVIFHEAEQERKILENRTAAFEELVAVNDDISGASVELRYTAEEGEIPNIEELCEAVKLEENSEAKDAHARNLMTEMANDNAYTWAKLDTIRNITLAALLFEIADAVFSAAKVFLN